LVGCWLVVWLVGWLVGWLCGWLIIWSVSWLVGWLVGWLVLHLSVSDQTGLSNQYPSLPSDKIALHVAGGNAVYKTTQTTTVSASSKVCNTKHGVWDPLE
jgi:hypothetical protein